MSFFVEDTVALKEDLSILGIVDVRHVLLATEKTSL